MTIDLGQSINTRLVSSFLQQRRQLRARQGRLLLLQARSEHEAALRQTRIEELQQAPAADQTKKELGRLRKAQTLWSSLSLAGEPFPALRLRCVDGVQVPKHPL